MRYFQVGYMTYFANLGHIYIHLQNQCADNGLNANRSFKIVAYLNLQHLHTKPICQFKFRVTITVHDT